MTQDDPCRGCGASANHVLVAPANVRGDDLENHAVVALPVAEGEFGEIDALDFHHSRSHICDTAIVCHVSVLLFPGKKWQFESFGVCLLLSKVNTDSFAASRGKTASRGFLVSSASQSSVRESVSRSGPKCTKSTGGIATRPGRSRDLPAQAAIAIQQVVFAK